MLLYSSGTKNLPWGWVEEEMSPVVVARAEGEARGLAVVETPGTTPCLHSHL